MRILALVKHGYGESGGVARYTQDLLNALLASSQKIELSVLAQSTSVIVDTKVPNDMRYLCVDSKSKFLYLIASFKFLLARRFDYVICAHLYLLPIACLFKIFRGTKITIVIYGIEAWKPRNILFHIYTKFVDKILSISNFTWNRFTAWSELRKEKFSILSPAIDLENFSSQSLIEGVRKKYALKDRPIILTVSRLQSGRNKGHDILIDCLPNLIKVHSNLIYLIVGDGDDKLRLEKKVDELSLNNYVIFTGIIDENEKHCCYHLSNVFFMAGEGEGFGIVYLEAFARGCPVIASKLDASSEVINSFSSGLLVDPNSQREVEDAIVQSLRFNKSIPPELKKYSLDNFNKQVELFIRDL